MTFTDTKLNNFLSIASTERTMNALFEIRLQPQVDIIAAAEKKHEHNDEYQKRAKEVKNSKRSGH